MSKRPSKGIMLELDALIDTRLATLGLLDPKYVENIDLAAYLTRENDLFSTPTVTREQYEQVYRERDTLTLKSAVVTGVLTLVKERLMEHLVGSDTPMTSAVLKVDLNITPYVLDDTERAELAGLVEFELGGGVEVNIINKPLNQLNLPYLGSLYHTVILYNWRDWARSQEASFRQDSVVGLFVVVPRLLEQPAPTEFENDEDKVAYETIGPFNAMEYAYADRVSLRFEDQALFSIRTA